MEKNHTEQEQPRVQLGDFWGQVKENGFPSCSFLLWSLTFFGRAEYLLTTQFFCLRNRQRTMWVGIKFCHTLAVVWLTACISETGTLHCLLYLATEAIKPLSWAPSPSYKVVRFFYSCRNELFQLCRYPYIWIRFWCPNLWLCFLSVPWQWIPLGSWREAE